MRRQNLRHRTPAEHMSDDLVDVVMTVSKAGGDVPQTIERFCRYEVL